MSIKEFRMREGSEQHRFITSRLDICGYAGGYGNGKTAGLCMSALDCASTYAEGRFLVGRATRPKLEDSTKPELIKWLPTDWVVDWPSERKNNIILQNGSSIEFRHIRQEGKGKGEQQSNLLSATYDGIFVDQMDDPEFSYKDFEDLIGRLRGTAKYTGDDPTMPKIGPQFFRFTANPTRNWLFREIVNPYFIYAKTGLKTKALLVNEVTQQPIIEVLNAPTSANERNTGAAFAQRMRAVFRGSAKKRFIDGNWDAYEGLVYPDYSDIVHVVQHERMQEYIAQQIIHGDVGVVEGYDYGQAVPSCYLLGFVNKIGDVLIVAGFYEAQLTIARQAQRIHDIRAKWKVLPSEPIYADPAIFKNTNATKDRVGIPISTMFEDEKIQMQRGANSIDAGVQKISSYLAVDEKHPHPITGDIGAPRLFISSDLDFMSNEFVDYYWNKNTLGQNVDKPRDVNDHSLDALKYLFTRQAKVIGMVRRALREINPAVFGWNEVPEGNEQKLAPRHM